MISALCALAIGTLDHGREPQVFAKHQVAEIQAFWQEENRVVNRPAKDNALYQAVPSAEGSRWLHAYYKKRNPGIRLIPGFKPPARNARDRQWDAWIKQRMASDQVSANQEAQAANSDTDFSPQAMLGAPADLAAFAGEPPAFYQAIPVEATTIRFNDYTTTLTPPDLPDDYLYLRFEKGVMASGFKTDPSQLKRVAQKAGVNPKLQSALIAVSQLEGSFDAVNTYDTGYVSVGFIQFACLGEGTGSLGRLLQSFKSRQPKSFRETFTQYGIEVDSFGQLIALDLETGKEFVGRSAALKIIHDRRLTAVFQRAGRNSEAFQVEQMRMASSTYSPLYFQFQAAGPKGLITGRVADIVASDAGLATLVDRLVNTGSIASFSDAVTQVAMEYNLSTLSELKKAEYQIIERMQYRRNFLAMASLAKPQNYLSDLVAKSGTPASEFSTGGTAKGFSNIPALPGVGEATSTPNPAAKADEKPTPEIPTTQAPAAPKPKPGIPVTEIGR
ncbi:MAG: hypothetical protein KDC26_11375 [Armatimonadetes bacterium]|nr:hypothetical protein [Armatimonadota bacterium]